jgi:aspartate/methionine/tyrosine aminotransferase
MENTRIWGVRSGLRASRKASSFTESVIREMTREAMEHGAVNLAQGFPDFPAPEEVKQAARRAIEEDRNQYPITWGERELRQAIAEKYERLYGMTVAEEGNVCVTCGSTEAMIASLLAVLDPGDEVVIFEPFYENYGPDTILAGATPRLVPLRAPDWTFDPDELAAAFNDRTRGIVLNTPNNPTGRVFATEELEAIAALCQRWDVIAFTDEIYEHITYDGARHVPIATIPGMEDRTVTISALSKTYSVTGWRVGWTVAPADLIKAIRTVHDFLTVGAPTPLQHAGVVALRLPEDYYRRIGEEYAERRALILEILAGRLLRDGRHQPPRVRERRPRRPAPGSGGGRGRGPRVLVLLRAGAGGPHRPVLVLQASGNHPGGRAPPEGSSIGRRHLGVSGGEAAHSRVSDPFGDRGDSHHRVEPDGGGDHRPVGHVQARIAVDLALR